MTEEEFARQVEWEGGTWGALECGLEHEDLPEGELREAWRRLAEEYERIKPLIAEVTRLCDKALMAEELDGEEGAGA